MAWGLPCICQGSGARTLVPVPWRYPRGAERSEEPENSETPRSLLLRNRPSQGCPRHLSKRFVLAVKRRDLVAMPIKGGTNSPWRDVHHVDMETCFVTFGDIVVDFAA